MQFDLVGSICSFNSRLSIEVHFLSPEELARLLGRV